MLAIVAAFSSRHCFRSTLASSLFLRAAIATRSASSASAFSRRSTSLSESESISIGTEMGTGTAFEVLGVEDMMKQFFGEVLPLHCISAFLIIHPRRLLQPLFQTPPDSPLLRSSFPTFAIHHGNTPNVPTYLRTSGRGP